MLGRLIAEPTIHSSQVLSADSQSGTLVALEQNSLVPTILVYDLATGQRVREIDISSITTTHPSFVRFISSTQVAVAYNSSAGPSLVNINTGAITTPTGTHGFYRSSYNYAAGDCNSSNNYGLYAENTDRTLTSFNSSTKTKYTSTMTWMGSAVKVYAICAKPSSGNFIIAQSDGYIREVDPTDLTLTPSHEFVLPAATYDGASVHQPDSIQLMGDRLVVTTQHGTMLVYEYSTGTLLSQRSLYRCISATTGNSGGCSFLVGRGTNFVVPVWMNSANNPTLSFWDVKSDPILMLDAVSLPSNNTSATAQITAAGIDSTTKTTWFIAGQPGKLQVYDCSRFFASTAKSEILSAGSPVAGTIIRLPLLPNGSTQLEVKQSISFVETAIATRFTDVDYLEIAVTGSGGTEKADVRLLHS